MIDKKAFAEGMAHLGALAHQPVDRATLRSYYEVLGSRMTTEEWIETVKSLEDTITFAPKPPEILKAWRKTTAYQARVAWRRLVQQDLIWEGFEPDDPRFVEYLHIRTMLDVGQVAAETAVRAIPLLMTRIPQVPTEWIALFRAQAQRLGKVEGPIGHTALPPVADHTPERVKQLVASIAKEKKV